MELTIDFVTIQKIRRESTEAGPAAAEPATNGVLTFKRRLRRALFGATVMSNPATPGFEKLKDTYACRASWPAKRAAARTARSWLARGTARGWGFDRWAWVDCRAWGFDRWPRIDCRAWGVDR